MNSFVIADPSLCIGCRTCEVACAVSHQSTSCTLSLYMNETHIVWNVADGRMSRPNLQELK